MLGRPMHADHVLLNLPGWMTEYDAEWELMCCKEEIEVIVL